MQIYSLHTGNFKLDGGAMFGVVPKSIWNKTNPADENNLCTWAMRSMLAVDGDRVVLLEVKIGDKEMTVAIAVALRQGKASVVGVSKVSEK